MYGALRRFFRPTTFQGRRVLVGFGFLVIAGLMSASIFATGPDAQPEPRLEKAWPVSTISAQPTPTHPTFRAYGRVESSRIAHLRTDLIAEVTAVHVREGDWVAAGARLITLDDRELKLRLVEKRSELIELEASLESLQIERESAESSAEHYLSLRQVAQNKLQRHEDLIAKRLISQGLLDEVMAQANQAEIQYQTHTLALADFPNRMAALKASIARAESHVQQAQLDIEKTNVVAPFGGPVLGIFVAPGDRSNLGITLADIADASAFEVRVLLPQNYTDRLQANLLDTEAIRAQSPDGRTLRLSRLSGQIKRGQSGLDAFFSFEGDAFEDASSTGERAEPASAALGRLLELVVTLPEEADVIALPVQSIYENDRVYAVEDNRLQAITVERVGETQTLSGEYRVLVRSLELSQGKAIITTQLPRAIEGLLVEPA